jgi:murein DD-endopeptidase MepM/ murein hydrolase activator NlpD
MLFRCCNLALGQGPWYIDFIGTTLDQANKPPQSNGGTSIVKAISGKSPVFLQKFGDFHGKALEKTSNLIANSPTKPMVLALSLVVLLLLVGTYFIRIFKAQVTSEYGVFGGLAPESVLASGNQIIKAAAMGESPIVEGFSAGPEPLLSLQSNQALTSFEDNGQPIGSVFSRDNLIDYTVQKGDTISGIAAYFGISLDTIVNANPDVRARYLKPGDNLKILPTSGIVYRTKEGDSLESIADYFNIPADKISQFNKSINFGTLGEGVSLVIPGAKSKFVATNSSLPNFNANFIKPADGFNWGILHHYNAVDIANTCGASIVASADGLVVPDESFGDGRSGWNGGYGSFVLLEHPFGDGVRTRYAHLQKVLVEIGDYVQQGQQIGIMGDTGDATGCHVHFEVYGAENPFAK